VLSRRPPGVCRPEGPVAVGTRQCGPRSPGVCALLARGSVARSLGRDRPGEIH